METNHCPLLAGQPLGDSPERRSSLPVENNRVVDQQKMVVSAVLSDGNNVMIVLL